MAKDKKGSKAVASAPAVSKPLESVKAGRVSKPIEKVKTTAKDATKKAAKGVKKSAKKVEKQVSSSESSSESHAGTSASSASSDDESEKEVKIKQEPKSKGAAAAPAAKQSKDTSDSDSDSSSSESDKEPAPKKAKAPKANGAAKSVAKKDDSSSDSDSSSDTGDDEKATTPKVNGKAEAGSDSSDSDSGSESDSSSDDEGDAKVGAEKGAKAADDDDSSDDSSSSDEEEEKVAKVAPAAKKRKAEEVIDQTPKKTKVAVNGEQKDAVSNLFVGNLSWNVDEEWLTREFEEFGELTGVRVITDRESGRSKGFGYVEFAEVDSAVQAIEAKQGAMVDNRNIRIDFSNPRPDKSDGATPQQRSSDRAQRYGDTPKEPSTTLFVGNVSFDADETMISELFQEYGTITSVRLPTDRESGSLKGFGYVDFTSIEEAQGAFDALQGADVAGRPIRLDYASQRSNNTDSPRGGFGGRGGGRGRGDRGGRGGFSDRGGRGGFDRGRGRGGPRGGRGGTTNRGGFGDFSGKKTSF